MRLNPLVAVSEDNSWLVVGSDAGSAKDPARVRNLRAHPAIDIEVCGDEGVQTCAVHATEIAGGRVGPAVAEASRRLEQLCAVHRHGRRQAVPDVSPDLYCTVVRPRGSQSNSPSEPPRRRLNRTVRRGCSCPAERSGGRCRIA
ncbi:nitroreductase/quinone reductase family protein [Rhodococcoides fascians]|uniref:nitroreductase/quinone reductase family protein n=1 Tax=Rhodococcoides fascians TaxID=1828 RepID=UPI002795CBD7|nr:MULTISPECIES: nitroreductase/quinone reductase family protein [Rhodococcus]